MTGDFSRDHRSERVPDQHDRIEIQILDIATEAEINKVSWTTRKRLIQDTTVVLVTVFLFTLFLFVVDIRSQGPGLPQPQ